MNSFNFTQKYLSKLLMVAVLLVSLAACSEDEPIILTQEQKIAGSWSGTVSQEGYDDDFVLTINLNEFVLNTVVGNGDYDQECDFQWTYLRKEGTKYIIEEKILNGFEYCIDGTLSMTVSNDDLINFVWTGSDYDDNLAYGTLSRVK